MRLSRHFQLREFADPGGTPVPGELVQDYRQLARRYLEPLRRAYGRTTVHSGYRTPATNRRVGGAPLSFHTRASLRPGAAADVSCERGTPREWHALLDRLGAPGLGLYPGHVHVDNRRGRARW